MREKHVPVRASFRCARNLVSVEDQLASPPEEDVAETEAVRCLECGAVYSKPAGGGTVCTNPGCPECGYLGWLSSSIPFSEEAPRHRFFGDRRLHLPA
jgi:hypothetical protein